MAFKKSKVKTKPVIDIDDDDEDVHAPAEVEIPVVDVAALQSRIGKVLKLSTFEPETKFWLDTGNSALNGVLGSEAYGIPYGKIIELAGGEHGGKTTLATILGGMAQKDGAAFGYVDVENSLDEDWVVKLGASYSNLLPFGTSIIPTKDGKDYRLKTAEELFAEAEMGMKELFKSGFEKQFWIVDSLANLQTKKMIEAGAVDQNMNTMTSRSVFLASALPRWVGLAANYNAMIVLINQTRDKPGVLFGSPAYEPCGRAVKHCAAVIVRVGTNFKRAIKEGDRTIGIHSKLKNIKNKAGAGSEQDRTCWMKVLWKKTPAKISFAAADDDAASEE